MARADPVWCDARMAALGLRRLLLALIPALLGALLVPLAPAGAAAPGSRFTGTARLPGCSGAVVRWASALDSDPAVVITNGHCVRFPFLGARETLVDVKQYKRIELLDGAGKVATTVRGTRLAYAAMYRTDLAVYELRESYADLAAAGVTPLTLATRGPARGDRVGIANTGYVGGRRCIDSACEESKRGRVVMKREMNYGQQTGLLTTCVGADRRFDLSAAGCRLPQPRS